MKLFRKLFKNEDGATAIEYALLAALIGIFCIGAFTYLGDEVSDTTAGAAEGLEKAKEDADAAATKYTRD
jgi:pilus assembly protein Flp/PilA